MKVLTPDTSVELLFKDTKGLIDTLRERPNCRVKYNPRSRASEANSRWITIGSQLPFTEIKSILVETLNRYKKLQFYSVSNDFYRCDFYREFEIGIGFGTKGAKELGLAPIPSDKLLNALETFESTEQLIALIRAHYQGEFKTFSTEPITVTSYHSAAVGAVDPPLYSQGRISGSEYLATTNRPELYGLTIRMHVDTLEDFFEQHPEIGPMVREWLENRGDAARDLAVCVNAEEPLHEPIYRYITEDYNKGTIFSDVPHTLKVSIVIANRANDARLVETLTDM